MIQAYAKITITAAGTPVRVTSNETVPADARGCHGVLIQALPGNTGKVYVGNSVMNKSAFTGLFGILAIPTSNSIPSWSAALTLAPAAIQLRDLYIDADINGEGVIVSILVP